MTVHVDTEIKYSHPKSALCDILWVWCEPYPAGLTNLYLIYQHPLAAVSESHLFQLFPLSSIGSYSIFQLFPLSSLGFYSIFQLFPLSSLGFIPYSSCFHCHLSVVILYSNCFHVSHWLSFYISLDTIGCTFYLHLNPLETNGNNKNL